MPGNLANEATEERLSRAVLPAKKPHPGATTLAVFEVTPDSTEFFRAPDGNTFEPASGDEPTSQRSNNAFAAPLILMHL
jgi:hypothetical protein